MRRSTTSMNVATDQQVEDPSTRGPVSRPLVTHFANSPSQHHDVYLDHDGSQPDAAAAVAAWFQGQGKAVVEGSTRVFSYEQLAADIGWTLQQCGSCLIIGTLSSLLRNQRLLLLTGIALGSGKPVTWLVPISDRPRVQAQFPSGVTIDFFSFVASPSGRMLQLEPTANPVFDTLPARATRLTA